MIDFIVCEDNNIFLNKNIETINKIMFSNNIEYKIYTFNDYNEELKKIIENNDNNKIYILDIELENFSGIDIARKIRKNDWNSLIIFSTAHFELFPHVFSDKLMIFDYISKFDDYEVKLTDSLQKCINIFNKERTINIKSNYETHNVKLNSIMYITFDKYKRKTLIKTDLKEIYTNDSITSIESKLDNNFKRISRGYIININMIKRINYNDKIIEFNNGEILEDVLIKKETA